MIDLFALLELYNTCSQADLSFDIAKAILENYGKLELSSLNAMAESLHVSPSSMNRFFRLLFYDNFSTFKREHEKRDEYYCLDHARGGGYLADSADSFASFNATFLAELGQTLATVAEEPLRRLEAWMTERENIIFVGIPMPGEVWCLQMELVLLGKRTSAFLAPNDQIKAVCAAGPDTLIVGLDSMRQDDVYLPQILAAGRERGAACACISHFQRPDTGAPLADLSVSYRGVNSRTDQFALSMILNHLGHQLRRRVLAPPSVNP